MDKNVKFRQLSSGVDALFFLIHDFEWEPSTKEVLKYCLSDLLDKINNFDNYEC